MNYVEKLTGLEFLKGVEDIAVVSGASREGLCIWTKSGLLNRLHPNGRCYYTLHLMWNKPSGVNPTYLNSVLFNERTQEVYVAKLRSHALDVVKAPTWNLEGTNVISKKLLGVGADGIDALKRYMCRYFE